MPPSKMPVQCPIFWTVPDISCIHLHPIYPLYNHLTECGHFRSLYSPLLEIIFAILRYTKCRVSTTTKRLPCSILAMPNHQLPWADLCPRAFVFSSNLSFPCPNPAKTTKKTSHPMDLLVHIFMTFHPVHHNQTPNIPSIHIHSVSANIGMPNVDEPDGGSSERDGGRTYS